MNPILENDIEFTRFADTLLDDESIPLEEKQAIICAKIENEMSSVQKVNSMIWYITKAKAQAAAIRERADTLRKWSDAIANRADYIQSTIESYMRQKDFDSLEATDFKIVFQNNPPAVVINSEADIPGQYRTVQTVVNIDKRAIKDAIKAGVTVPGAELAQSKRLVIK
jgi:transcription termination factor NusB